MSEKYTKKQGQYLDYTKMNGRAPAHADLQDYLEVSPPSVHQMLLKLEERGLITKEAGVSRSIKVARSTIGLVAQSIRIKWKRY